MKKALLLFLGAVLLCGCVKSGVQEFYTPVPLPSSHVGNTVPCNSPQVFGFPNGVASSDIGLFMFEDGYIEIGNASWNGAEENVEAEAIKKGAEVGACIVLINTEYTGAHQSVIPVTNYNPGTTSTVYATNGGTATIYNPGTTSTNYIPHSVSRFNYEAVFFAKLKEQPHLLGVTTRLPPESYMQLTDSRTGILVVAVRKNSVAYKANIFKGDIISKVNGTPCTFTYGKIEQLKNNSENELEIYRNGKYITKKVTLSGS